MASRPPLPEPFLLRDLRGGMENTDEPQAIPENMVADARNIDWMLGTIGGKRAGCSSLSVDASVLNRVIPIRAQTATGGVTGGASFNISVPATTNDGTGTTFTAIVVRISTKANTDVTAVTYGGVALTERSADNSGASGRLETWALTGASLAGGTVAVTLAGACDAAGVAEFYQRVDLLTIGAAGASAINTQPRVTTVTDPTFLVTAGFSYDTGATGTTPLFAPVASLSQGNARLWVASEQGRKPSTVNWFTLSASKEWVGRSLTLRGAPLSSFTAVGFTFLAVMRHTPTINLSEDELWMVDLFGRIDRRVGGTWQTGVPVVNYYIGVFDSTGLDINGASLHGKFFIAAQQVINGLLVWDGTILRHAGFPNVPPAPTVASTAGVGTYSGTRYFRIRYTAQDGSGRTLRRSEPTTVTAFVPGGANDGAVITKPSGTEDYTSLFMNGQTHWEVEASLDNTIFYRIATVAIGTATYTDTTALGTTYSSNPVSESIGEYVAPGAVRHIAVDDDRLMMAGNRFTQGSDARVQWTPVALASGVGNDERIPATTGNTLDLDNLDGGGVTMMIAGESGNVYAFKMERTYKLTRTGILTDAYRHHTESHSRGAIIRAACSGHARTAQGWAPCVYFVDPAVGLCRASRDGIQELGEAVLDTWEAAEKGTASVRGPRIAYHPTKRQVWVAYGANGSDIPNKLLVYTARYGGFAIYESPLMDNGIYGDIVMYPDGGLPLLPVIGMLNPPLVKFPVDAITDAGHRYRAYFLSRAYHLGIYQKFGVVAGLLFARVANSTIGIKLIRNLGLGTNSVTKSIASSGGSETHVFKPIDDARISECNVVQFEIGDPSTFSGSQLDQSWILDEYIAKVRFEEESTS